ncbi:MAG: M48 family metallopeptidase [Sideroxyarcus sp.]|nr:M48 family metallopeptidase [Sideroxyarcus sp.]
MQKQDYESLVWSLQSVAQDDPGVFRTKVLLISLFAYLVLFGVLAVLLLGLYFMFAEMLGNGHTVLKIFFAGWVLVVAPIVWLTFRMFFMPLPVPQGRELTEAEAPQLFKMISDLRERLQAAPIHHVLITDEFNAAIAQCPRFGLFGGYRNYLILGLPLLDAVSAEELLSVVAHEYGHLSGGHGKLSRWIYRQRNTFDTLYEHVCERREDNVVNGILAGMLDWFAPYYNAYTFVLSRQNEYEADAMSSRIAGAEASASALIRINLLSNWLHGSFWPKLYAQSTQHETPPVMPYVAMRKLLVMTMDEWSTKERLNEVCKVESDVYDTHPCLSERLAAMGQRAVLPAIPKICAADAVLGRFSPELVREFDAKWWGEEKDKWQKYHRRYTRSKTRIEELEKKPVGELSVSEAQEFALLLVEFRSAKAAKYVLEDLLGRSGERYPKPVYFYGRALLDEGDTKGLDYLEEAFRLSPAMGDDCARAGYEFLREKQNETAAEGWLERLRTVHA